MDREECWEYIRRVAHFMLKWEEHMPRLALMTAWLTRADMIMWAGNGGSGATASHMCGEFVKECGKRSICLTDSTHVLTATSNDTSYHESLMTTYDAMRLDPGRNTVVVYSGSGNSENVCRLVSAALLRGDRVIAFVGYKGSRVRELCEGRSNAVCVDLGLAPLTPYAMQIAEDVHHSYSHMLFKKCLSEP